jgi:hypothetical protein
MSTEKLEDVVGFLLGEKPLDGHWFGDTVPAVIGAYWWRTHLRQALTAWNTRPSVVPAELAELSAKATQGEWGSTQPDHAPWLHLYAADGKHLFHKDRSDDEAMSNARLIAAAVNYVRAMLSASGEG